MCAWKWKSEGNKAEKVCNVTRGSPVSRSQTRASQVALFMCIQTHTQPQYQTLTCNVNVHTCSSTVWGRSKLTVVIATWYMFGTLSTTCTFITQSQGLELDLPVDLLTSSWVSTDHLP